MNQKHKAIMEDFDVIDRRIDAMIADNANLRAERDALAERLRQSADMREIVAELRHIHAHMHNGQVPQARAALGDLLRRFDRESQ